MVTIKIISFIILFVITFWFKGNILYWTDTETKKYKPEYYLKFQLDHKGPPTVNEKPISFIKVTEKEVFVAAEDKCWIVNYTQNADAFDWYVEGPFSL